MKPIVRIVLLIVIAISMVLWTISAFNQGWDTIGIMGIFPIIAMLASFIVILFLGNKKDK